MTGDLGRFKSTLVYDKQGPAETLMADVQSLREFDKQSEASVKTYKIITLVSVLAFAAGIGLTILTASPLCLVVALAGIVGAITGGVLWARGAKFDLANKRYELFGELVRLLSRDMAKDAPLTAALDLAPANDARKKVSEGEAGVWKVTYFVDPWLKLSGRFADGTSFQIALTEKFQARGKWKRSRSGKNKYKQKNKTTTQGCVRLFPKEKRYENLAKVTDKAESLLRLPPWVGVKKLDATAEELSLTTFTSENWGVRRQEPQTQYDGVELMAMMLLSMYQVLHASKALSPS